MWCLTGASGLGETILECIMRVRWTSDMKQVFISSYRVSSSDLYPTKVEAQALFAYAKDSARRFVCVCKRLSKTRSSIPILTSSKPAATPYFLSYSAAGGNAGKPFAYQASGPFAPPPTSYFAIGLLLPALPLGVCPPTPRPGVCMAPIRF